MENKQKFIAQIMTSKSPVRSCDDVDETALSFAEIKALCAGDPRIKERMELDVDVAKLKIMKAGHQSQQFQMEDRLLKYFPEQIKQNQEFIAGFETDLKTLSETADQQGFTGMEIRGEIFRNKAEAGKALLSLCQEVKPSERLAIGSYRGFQMSLAMEGYGKEITLTLKGQMSHRAVLAADPLGNLTRIDHALEKMPERLSSVRTQLESLYQQQEAAKAEVGKPFPQEDELRQKSARLAELDVQLNIDRKPSPQEEQAIAKSARPSVLEKLKQPLPPREKKEPKRREPER